MYLVCVCDFYCAKTDIASEGCIDVDFLWLIGERDLDFTLVLEVDVFWYLEASV